MAENITPSEASDIKNVETTISQLGNHLSSVQGEISSKADFATVYIKQDIDSETLSVWPRNSYSSVENQQENCLDEKPVIPQEEENFPLLDHLLPNAPVDGNLLFNVEPSFSEHFPGFKIQNCKNSSKFLQTEVDDALPSDIKKQVDILDPLIFPKLEDGPMSTFPSISVSCKFEPESQKFGSTSIRDEELMKSTICSIGDENPIQCDICKKTFTQLSTLTVHKRVHTGERPFQCGICKKTFAKSGNLIKHKRVHTGKKPFQCDICKKNFAQSGHLISHKQVHTDKKLFECDICKKTFAQSTHLTRHKRVHTGEKPFHCDICKKTFARLDHLATHKRVHTGEKPFQCDICKKTFGESGSLTRHKRVHTREKCWKCNIYKNLSA